ncbi:MAG TPA: GNAT family protein [Candidatus Bathyarchaeia archaeon]
MNNSVLLEDGRRANIVVLTPDDVDRLHNLLTNLSDDDAKWSMAPYQREWVQKWLNTPTLIQLAAEHSGELVGFVCVEEWTHPRRRGTGYLGAYVHRDYRSTGLLSEIVGRLLDKVKEKGLHKVDTEAVAENASTISVLEEQGFQVEGRKRECFYGADGRYYDTLIMGKVLD